MSQELIATLKDSIEKNLPSMVGEQLKGVLKDYETLKELVIDLKESHNVKDVRITELQATNKKLTEDLSVHDALAAREKAVLDREIRLEVTELKIRLECANKTNEAITGALAGLVRNSEFRSTSFSNEQKAVSNTNGPGFLIPATSSTNNTTTQE